MHSKIVMGSHVALQDSTVRQQQSLSQDTQCADSRTYQNDTRAGPGPLKDSEYGRILDGDLPAASTQAQNVPKWPYTPLHTHSTAD